MTATVVPSGFLERVAAGWWSAVSFAENQARTGVSDNGRVAFWEDVADRAEAQAIAVLALARTDTG